MKSQTAFVPVAAEVEVTTPEVGLGLGGGRLEAAEETGLGVVSSVSSLGGLVASANRQ